MSAYYVLEKNPSASQPYRFSLKAANHETILSSENYASRQGAQNGIASCQSNSGNQARYGLLTSKAEQPYFVLKAGNHEIIGTSQMYKSVASRDQGLASCMSNGATTTIKDLT